MKICIVIPFYNHANAIGAVLHELKRFRLPCIVVDDGSDAGCRPQLQSALACESDWVQLIGRESNGGKGAAVMTGCDAAADRGFTHVLQIDADGQHDTNDIPQALELATAHPDALISGYPIYDESVPAGRRYGRYLTHCWVWINTWSLEIRDSMCGFRVYPLAAARRVWASHRMSRRMDFDIEIMVRMFWNGTRVISFPTHVTYPKDGVSHFDVLRDNVRISIMHARLFVGMVPRIPCLALRTLKRRPQRVAA